MGTACGINCTNPHVHVLAVRVQSAGAGRRRSQALRDSTVNLEEEMSEMIELTQAFSSICPWPHQSRLSPVLVGSQEAQEVCVPLPAEPGAH